MRLSSEEGSESKAVGIPTQSSLSLGSGSGLSDGFYDSTQVTLTWFGAISDPPLVRTHNGDLSFCIVQITVVRTQAGSIIPVYPAGEALIFFLEVSRHPRSASTRIRYIRRD